MFDTWIVILVGCAGAVAGLVVGAWWGESERAALRDECAFRIGELKTMDKIVEERNRTIDTLRGWIRRKGVA